NGALNSPNNFFGLIGPSCLGTVKPYSRPVAKSAAVPSANLGSPCEHCGWNFSSRTEEEGMQISFKGKRVVVAGGSRGIGRSIALAFADAGAAVSICARGPAALDKTSAEIMGRGVKAHAGVCDLADKGAIA